MTDPAAPTVGVEEEFLLLRPDGGPACIAPEVLSAVGGTVCAHPEFVRYQVESATGICTDLPSVGEQLGAARRALARVAADRGARLVAVGTPPFEAPGRPALTDDLRFHRLVTGVPGITGGEVSCACHVHIGVATRDLGVAVLNRIRGWLPVLLALTGNSPLWQGRDTGWSSFRIAVQQRWPTSIMPPRCRDAAEYDDVVARLIGLSAAVDPASVYFFARLSPRYPTVEVRIADVCLTVGEAVLVAGLCRALVATAVADEEAGRPVPAVPERALAAAGSAAAREGLSARLLDPWTGRPVAGPALLAGLVAHLAPALKAAGDDRLVDELLVQRLRLGSGAVRQRALWRPRDREAFVRALGEAGLQ